MNAETMVKGGGGIYLSKHDRTNGYSNLQSLWGLTLKHDHNVSKMS